LKEKAPVIMATHQGIAAMGLVTRELSWQTTIAQGSEPGERMEISQ